MAYGNISAQLIIEWVEAMRYIGVDKIVTYFHKSLNSDALNVLRHYAAEGFVDLSLYEPAKEGDYSLLYLSLRMRKLTIWVSDQFRHKKVQVGKDQEKAQSEKDSHSKNRGGKKPN